MTSDEGTAKVAAVVLVENSKVHEHMVVRPSCQLLLRSERTDGRWRVMMSEE